LPAVLSYQHRTISIMPPPPPPASGIASKLFLGQALRTQSDRRLVSLVRDGYENAFEEIVRRYGGGLRRFAGAIVPAHRAEDVTQDSFSKALLALRDTDKEIELRPWLYRIVRNTALNDLRDQPAPSAELRDVATAAADPALAAERREEIIDLMDRLRALPDPQRAAIVMRELEGLSHEEIAAALGVSGGAARQAIYHGRQALRRGLGALVPIPLLHYLLAGGVAGAEAAAGGLAAGGVAASSLGGGAALKAGIATVVVAGSVTAGVALNEGERQRVPEVTSRSGIAGPGPGGETAVPVLPRSAPTPAPVTSSGSSGRDESSGDGDDSRGEDRRSDELDEGEDEGPDDSSGSGSRDGESDPSGPGSGEPEDEAESDDDDNSGPGGGSDSSGSSGSGSRSGSVSGSFGSESGSSGSGSDSSASDSSGSGIRGSDSGEAALGFSSGSSGSGSSESGSGDEDPDSAP